MARQTSVDYRLTPRAVLDTNILYVRAVAGGGQKLDYAYEER